MSDDITIAHAQDERATDCIIRIAGVPPEIKDNRKWAELFKAFYSGQGAALEETLWQHLPGGTYDALLYHILERKATLYRVAYGSLR